MAMTSFLDNPNGKMSLFFIYFIYTRCMTGTMTTPALSFSKKRDLEMRILTVRPASQWSRTYQGRASTATRSSSCSARNTFQRVRSHNFWNQGNKVANKTLKKIALGVNFISILWSAFFVKVLLPKNYKHKLKVKKSCTKHFCAK